VLLRHYGKEAHRQKNRILVRLGERMAEVR